MVRVNLLLSHLHVVNKFMVHVQHRLQNSIAHVTCSCLARPLKYLGDFLPGKGVYLYAEFVHLVLLDITSRIFKWIIFEM